MKLIMRSAFEKSILVLLRLAMGWLMFWAFLDKTFGLGYDTLKGRGWLDGVSPTLNFLKYETKGPLIAYFQQLTGQPWVDWVFMVGLGLIGLALILGICVRLAGFFGFVMMGLIFAATLWPQSNPVLDENAIYALCFLVLMMTHSGQWLGLGGWWVTSGPARSIKILE